MLLAGALVCGTVVLPPGPGSGIRALILAVGAIAVTVAAVASHSPPAVRAGVVAATIFVIFTAGAWLRAGPSAPTVAACVLLLAVLALLGRRSAWRPAMPWLRRGRVDRVTWLLGGVTIVVTAVALSLFALLAGPEVSAYLAMLRTVPA